MVKGITSITLDIELLQLIKEYNINISKLINEFLINYLKFNKDESFENPELKTKFQELTKLNKEYFDLKEKEEAKKKEKIKRLSFMPKEIEIK